MKYWMALCLLPLFFSCYVTSVNAAPPPPQVSLIIDDFGGKVKGVEEMLDLDLPLTVAIMPFMEDSHKQAVLAAEKGHEVMLHLPMEPLKGKASWLGPGAIRAEMTKEEAKQATQKAIDSLPHVKGLNNHMGSKVVETSEAISGVLEAAKENQLYVIDSGTNPRSLIPELCESMGIPYEVRDVFLDDTLSSAAEVKQQMKHMAKRTESDAKTIAIGHVGIKGEETVTGIKEGLSFLKSTGTEIVPASKLTLSNISRNPFSFWEY